MNYTELMKIEKWGDRLESLKVRGLDYEIPKAISERLYKSHQWKIFAKEIRKRDGFQDMGIKGEYIDGRIIVHHINPLETEDILYWKDCCFDPENVISVSLDTHNAIHYKCKNDTIEERRPGDTKLW